MKDGSNTRFEMRDGSSADEWMMSNQPLIATHAPSQGQAAEGLR